MNFAKIQSFLAFVRKIKRTRFTGSSWEKFGSAPSRNPTFISTPHIAAQLVLKHLYSDGTKPERMKERNDAILQLFAQGVPKMEIGRRFGISARRVGQILDG